MRFQKLICSILVIFQNPIRKKRLTKYSMTCLCKDHHHMLHPLYTQPYLLRPQLLGSCRVIRLRLGHRIQPLPRQGIRLRQNLNRTSQGYRHRLCLHLSLQSLISRHYHHLNRLYLLFRLGHCLQLT